MDWVQSVTEREESRLTPKYGLSNKSGIDNLFEKTGNGAGFYGEVKS